MRLDMFLKISRLVSRRSIAQDLCNSGRVAVNENAARPSKEVKTGDIIKIDGAGGQRTIKISRIPDSKQVSKLTASELYEVVEETIAADPIFD